MMSMEPFYIHMAQRRCRTSCATIRRGARSTLCGSSRSSPLLGDPVAVYTANIFALSIGVSVLIYLHLLLLTRRAAAGVGAALFFLICDFNVPLASKVSGFALMVDPRGA